MRRTLAAAACFALAACQPAAPPPEAAPAEASNGAAYDESYPPSLVELSFKVAAT